MKALERVVKIGLAVAAVVAVGVDARANETGETKAYSLKREAGRTYIDGLQNASWGCGHRENSVFGAMSVALKAMGEDVSYDRLMGVSGAAFRVQMMQPAWCPSAPHANIGFQCVPPAMTALGYEFQNFGEFKPDDEASVARIRSAVAEYIDKGVPVLYMKEETDLVVGYSDGGKTLMLRKYCSGTGYTTTTDLPWGFEVVRRDGNPIPSDKEVATTALKLALDLANAEGFGENPGGAFSYAAGFNAYAFWIKGLKDEAAFAAMAKKELDGAMRANGHCYYSLVDARGSAAAYLEDMAGQFGGMAARHLRTASRIYKRITEEVLAKTCPTKIAPMPWFLKDGQTWTQRMRDRQAKLLKKSAGLERQALKAIKEALRALERV